MDREELLTKTPQELLKLLDQRIITIEEWEDLPISVRLTPCDGDEPPTDDIDTYQTN
jgi:hypothetical protein